MAILYSYKRRILTIKFAEMNLANIEKRNDVQHVKKDVNFVMYRSNSNQFPITNQSVPSL